MASKLTWRKIAPWAIALGVVLVAWGGVHWYRSNNPRYLIRGFLVEALDKLHADLLAFQPGQALRDDEVTSFQTDRGAGIPPKGTTLPIPLSSTICNDADRVRDTLAVFPMDLALDARDDPDDFKDWADELKQEYESRAVNIAAEIKRIEKQFRADAVAFRTYFSGDSVGFTLEGELYFVIGDNGQGCLVEKAMHIDFAKWADNVVRLGNTYKIPGQ